MRFTVLTAAAVIAWPIAALAQEAQTVEGPGVKVDESTIVHPTVGIEAGVISNVFYETEQTVPVGSGILRLLGQLHLASRGNDRAGVAEAALADEESTEPTPPTLQFRGGLAARYDEFLSGESIVRSQRNLGVEASMHAVAFPEGTFAFLFDDSLTRDTRPQNFENYGGNNRIINQLGLGLRFQPGGRTISAAVRYDNSIDFFEASEHRFADRMNQTVGLRCEWQWLPITRFLLDASYGYFGPLGSNTLDGMPYKLASNPMRGELGIVTAITEMTTIRAHAGWTSSSYPDGTGFNAPVFGAEFGYRYNEFGRFTVLYAYDFRDSLNADFYRDHAIDINVAQQIREVLFEGSGGLRLRSYHGISPVIGDPDRDDVIIEAKARGQWMYRDWLAFVVQYVMQSDKTPYRSMTVDRDNPSFVRHEATAGIRAAF